MNLAGSYVILKEPLKGKSPEVFWVGAKISPYQPKNVMPDYNPERFRKLLLKKSEIKHLIGKSKQKGLTLIPLKVYTKDGKIKIEFAIAKGKKKYDKKELIKKIETEREMARELKLRG